MTARTVWKHIALGMGLFFTTRIGVAQVHATDGILEGRVSLFERANTAGSEAYLSESEKSLILILNTARLDGGTFVRRYLSLAKDTGTERYQAIKRILLTKESAPALRPAFGLAKSAAIQATDMGRNGLQGTANSEGRPYYDRIHEQLPEAATYASAFYLGSSDPLDAVLHLLVEDADTTTWRILLSPKLDYVGVAIRPHKMQCSNTVIDFARRPASVPMVGQTNKKRKKTEAYFMDCPKGSKIATPRKPSKAGSLFGWIF